MARLSVEHYRANVNMTPDHTRRKSGRFRDIFKSRSSLSPSTLDLSGKVPRRSGQLSPPASPRSPTVKPGFEKVGILPSERSSFVDAMTELERHGGNHVAEALAKQEEDLKGVSVPHGLDTSLEIAHAGHQDESAMQAAREANEASARDLAVAFNDAVATYQRDETSGRGQADGGDEPKLRHRRGRQNLSIDESAMEKSSELAEHPGFFDLNAARSGRLQSHSETYPPVLWPHQSAALDEAEAVANHYREMGIGKSSNGLFSDAGDETFINTTNVQPSPRNSFASNIFDSQDPLSKGIREYVDSKVAEAMLAYERTNGRSGTKHTNITFKIDVANLVKKMNDTKPATCHSSPKPRYIGGWTITDPAQATVMQRLVIGFYLILIVLAVGFSSVPRLLVSLGCIVVGLKLAAVCNGCYSAASANLLLAPVIFVYCLVQGVMRGMLKGLVKVVVEALEEVVDETDVEVETTTT